MKNVKKILALVLALLMTVSLLTACGGNDDATKNTDTAANNTTPPTEEATAPEAPVEEITGTVTICLETAKKDVFEPFIAAFEDTYPGITVEVLWDKDQNQLIAANQAPDIIKSGDIHVSSSKDILLDLTPYAERDAAEIQIEDFFTTSIESLKVDGKLMALPTSFNVCLLYYNKDLFDAAGLAYPTDDWTQDDFVKAGQALTVGADGSYSQWGCTTVLGWWGEWLVHVRQSGGDWMVDDLCALDTPEAISGLQFFYDKTTNGTLKFAPSSTDDALGGFAGGKTAMEYGGHTGMWASYNAVEGLNWDIAELPSGSKQKAGSELAIEGYAISNTTANPEAAWAFLKYFTGYEGAKIMSELGYPCCRQSVANELLAVPKEERSYPQNLEALYAAMDDSMALPRDPEFTNCTQTIVQPIIDLMLEGELTPEEAAKQATADANDYLESVR